MGEQERAAPFAAAVGGLTSNPAIIGNPAAAQAVSDAKAQAEKLAATAGSATVAVVAADAQTAFNPAIAALGTGAEPMADAYLTAALGPTAEAILAPGAHVVIDLGEKEALALVSTAFAKARAMVQWAQLVGKSALAT